ncbi:hypothetical protein [Neptunomonas antarctica]|uniref:Uncharacterized protein n=1 Tax=Neptunomonas antarctica TaxID=619304 RepID=A0A1N7PAM5_9GAMM|nr:hypothetical protein [Neptunomonas antarctica]SIT07672.1 hypothetical protein SAMN05421760_11399 [Neptunomonas antarctica]
MNWLALKRRLVKQADNVQQNLILLISGLGFCLLGLLLVTMAEYLFGQSLQQELVALAGIALIAIGGLLAIAGYLSLSLLRIFRVLVTDEKKKK